MERGVWRRGEGASKPTEERGVWRDKEGRDFKK